MVLDANVEKWDRENLLKCTESKSNFVSESMWTCITAMGISGFQAINCLDVLHLGGDVLPLLLFHAPKSSVGSKVRDCVKGPSLLNTRPPGHLQIWCIYENTHSRTTWGLSITANEKLRKHFRALHPKTVLLMFPQPMFPSAVPTRVSANILTWIYSENLTAVVSSSYWLGCRLTTSLCFSLKS